MTGFVARSLEEVLVVGLVDRGYVEVLRTPQDDNLWGAWPTDEAALRFRWATNYAVPRSYWLAEGARGRLE